jgi:hypothetical protein
MILTDGTAAVMIEWFHEMLSLFGLEVDWWYHWSVVEYVENIKDRNVQKNTPLSILPKASFCYLCCDLFV